MAVQGMNTICFCKFQKLFLCQCNIMPMNLASLSQYIKDKVKEYSQKSLNIAQQEEAEHVKSIQSRISHLLTLNKNLFESSQHKTIRSSLFNDINRQIVNLLKQLKKQQTRFLKVKKRIKNFLKYLKRHNNSYQTNQVLTKVIQKIGGFLFSVFRPDKLMVFETISNHESASNITTPLDFSSVGLICKRDEDSFFYLRMKHNQTEWVFTNMIINISKKTVDLIHNSNYAVFKTSNPVRYFERIYLFGGYDQTGSMVVYSECLNTDSLLWTRVSPLPRQDAEILTTLAGEYILIASRFFKYCFFYHPELDKYYESYNDGSRTGKVLASVTVLNQAFLIGTHKICFFNQEFALVELFENSVSDQFTFIRDCVVVDDKAYLLGTDNRVFCFAPRDYKFQMIRKLGQT